MATKSKHLLGETEISRTVFSAGDSTPMWHLKSKATMARSAMPGERLSPTSKAILIHDIRAEEESPGRARRLETLRQYGITSYCQLVEYRLDSAGGPSNRWLRLRSMPAHIRRMVLEPLAPDTDIIIAGFGAPHLLLLAVILSALRPQRIIFDSCDSWLLQSYYRFRQAGVRLTFPPLAGCLLQVLLVRPNSQVMYISERDRRADTWIRRVRGEVLQPVLPDSLSTLEPCRLPLKRLVIAADLSSFHNQSGFRMIMETLDRINSGPKPLSADVFIYGPNPPKQLLPPGVSFQGWADNIRSIYEGNTGVLITNTSGSGIANKLIEAVQARRPAIAPVNSQSPCRVEASEDIYQFRSSDELELLLRRLTGEPELESSERPN